MALRRAFCTMVLHSVYDLIESCCQLFDVNNNLNCLLCNSPCERVRTTISVWLRSSMFEVFNACFKLEYTVVARRYRAFKKYISPSIGLSVKVLQNGRKCYSGCDVMFYYNLMNSLLFTVKRTIEYSSLYNNITLYCILLKIITYKLMIVVSSFN